SLRPIKQPLNHVFFFFQAEDGIRARNVTGVQTCALPISTPATKPASNLLIRGVSTPTTKPTWSSSVLSAAAAPARKEASSSAKTDRKSVVKGKSVVENSFIKHERNKEIR